MAERINITIDLSKIDKSRIITRTFTNKEGQEVTVKEYKLEVVPSLTPKTIKEGDTWTMVKTHFVVEGQTKEERQAKKKSTILGDGIVFRNKLDEINQDTNLEDYNQDSDIPF